MLDEPHTHQTPVLPDGTYAIVELLGHCTLIGRIEEVERFGTKMIQVEPVYQGRLLDPVLHGGSAIYGLTSCSKELAATKGATQRWQLPDAIRAQLPAEALPAPDEAEVVQAAQDFTVNIDLAFGPVEHAAFRANENGALSMPPGAWVPGARYLVIADRQGATTRRGLTAIPAADADYYLGLPIGGFTIGEDNHPDPATAWDLCTEQVPA